MTIQIARPLPRKSVLSVAIAGLLLGPGVQAATLTVDSLTDDGTGCTLREAIESINAGSNQGGCTADVTEDYGTNDTILFDASVTGTITLNGTQLGITQSMSIEGPGAAGLAVDGNGTSRVFNISGAGVAVAIDRLTIQNGAITGTKGGGIAVTGTTEASASLALSNSTVSGNSVSGDDGGGLYAFRSSVTLTNSTVSGNSASNSGGGLWASSSSVTLTNSTVSDNSARDFGGGLLATNGSFLTLTNSTVTGGLSRDGGGLGAIFSSVTITNSTVSGNSADFDGGGLWASSSSVTLANSTVSDNSAGYYGGGLLATNGSFLTLTDSTVTGNAVRDFGGGLGAISSSVTITNSRVSGNSAGLDGGGLFALSETFVTLSNTTVSGNSAGRLGGGGLFAVQSSATLTNSTVSGNSAGDDGGGLLAVSDTSVTLTNSTVSGNLAGRDGGGLFVGSNPVTLTNTLLTGNGTDCRATSSNVTGSFNLIGDAASACGLTNGIDNNLVGVDPLIGPLADNGCVTKAGNPDGPEPLYGCVQTHALPIGSPALDAANSAVCDAAPVNGIDQRGVARPQPSGGACDIGAFELGPAAPPTDVSVTPVARGLLVSWTEPVETGLSPLATCTATADPGGASCSVAAGVGECTIPDLNPEVVYTVTVACTNEDGVAGLASQPSDPLTPLDPPPPPPIPALPLWGLLGGAGLLGLLGVWRGRRVLRERRLPRRQRH